MRDPETRAAVGYMSATFKIHPLGPKEPDIWVDSISDALYSAGMFAIFLAADCRDSSEVPIRTLLGNKLSLGQSSDSHCRASPPFTIAPSDVERGIWKVSSGLSLTLCKNAHRA